MSEWYIEQFKEVKEELGIDDTSASILVLASSIGDIFCSGTLDDIGHELAMALKNVLKESKININNIN
jgi:hypothetical protein